MVEGVAQLDIDVELEELEIRLERLRALYEQYFMGIEKIEPSIARKDVDRRIWVLRREKMRNTAKRFKFQTLVQRYNTFQQYWGRICREIEAGTYKRHMLRAEKILAQPLTIAAKKRLGRFARRTEAQEEAEAAQPEITVPEPAETTMPDAELDALLGIRGARGAPGARPAAPAVPASAAPVARAAPPTQPGAKPRVAVDRLDLDIEDLLGGSAPMQASARPSQRAGAPVGAKPVAAAPIGARPVGAAPLSGRPPSAVGSGRPAGEPPLAAKPAPGDPQGGPRRVKPPLPARAQARSADPPAWDDDAPTPPPSNPRASAVAQRPVTSPGNPPLPQRAASPPRSPAPAPRPAAAPAARPQPPAAADGVSEQRVRELHARLLDAKRQTNDKSAVSVEGLAKTLRATETSLRQRHAGRQIDFDVVIRDGKAVLKPIVKG